MRRPSELTRTMHAPEPHKPNRRRMWRKAKPTPDMESVFVEHLPLIERVAESACRRAGLQPHESEDFVAQVKLKLIDDDYAVLRKHRGDSRLTTYLVTVVNNQFKDHCNHLWGKFRHSAAAKRLGADAKALERLLVIDRHDLESAIEILKTNHRVETSREELRDIAAQLPQRQKRRFVGEEVLEQRASEAPEADAEQRVEASERTVKAEQVEEVLQAALEALSPQDLLILKMFYRDGCTVAAIAAALGLEARPLYSRKERCHASLRKALEAQGLTWEEVRDILGWQGREVRVDFGVAEPAKKDDSDQKNEDESV